MRLAILHLEDVVAVRQRRVCVQRAVIHERAISSGRMGEISYSYTVDEEYLVGVTTGITTPVRQNSKHVYRRA